VDNLLRILDIDVPSHIIYNQVATEVAYYERKGIIRCTCPNLKHFSKEVYKNFSIKMRLGLRKLFSIPVQTTSSRQMRKNIFVVQSQKARKICC